MSNPDPRPTKLLIPGPFQLPPPPPLGEPSQEILDLHRKAVDRPDSLTDADRRRVLQRPPADEEDRLCREICGLGWNELIRKALAQPEELSDDEAQLACHGIRCLPVIKKSGGPDYDFYVWAQRPKEEQDRMWKARSIAMTEDENTAFERACHGDSVAKRHWRDAQQRLSHDDRLNIAYLRTKDLPWVQEAQQLPAWGFVLFRAFFDDEDAWRRFKELFTDAIETSLLAIHFSARIRRTWTVQYIEDDPTLAEASLPQLRTHFSALCRDDDDDDDADGPRILPGLRRDAFLYANADAIASVLEAGPLPQRGHVWAADPSFPFKDTITASTKGPWPMTMPPFEGVVPVVTTAVFTSFYARLDPTAPDPAHPDPRKANSVKQNWGLIWRKSRLFGGSNMVYPPGPPQLNM